MVLIDSTRPAERERRCIWASNFNSPFIVVQDNGAITGYPSFSNDGVDLDGTSDNLAFNICPSMFRTASSISIVVEFTPHFAYDANNTRQLLDATSGSRYAIVKQNNANSNVLTIYLGNTLIADISSAVYGTYWNANAKNRLVITGTTGDTDVWLNGTQILDAGNTAWSAAAPTVIYVGSQYGAINRFDGVIHSLKIFKVRFTDEEAENYSNGTMIWNYENDATINLPGTMKYHDATNNLALGANGTNGTITGCTKATNHPGYVFDGSDDNIEVTLTGNQTSMTIAHWIQRGSAAGTVDYAWTQYLDDNITLGLGLFLTATSVYIRHNSNGTSLSSNYNIPTYDYGFYHLVSTIDTTKVWRFYVNGILVYTSAALIIPSYGTRFSFGLTVASFAGTQSFMKIWENKVLTNLQILDLYEKEKIKIGDNI